MTLQQIPKKRINSWGQIINQICLLSLYLRIDLGEENTRLFRIKAINNEHEQEKNDRLASLIDRNHDHQYKTVFNALHGEYNQQFYYSISYWLS